MRLWTHPCLSSFSQGDKKCFVDMTASSRMVNSELAFSPILTCYGPKKVSED